MLAVSGGPQRAVSDHQDTEPSLVRLRLPALIDERQVRELTSLACCRGAPAVGSLGKTHLAVALLRREVRLLRGDLMEAEESPGRAPAHEGLPGSEGSSEFGIWPYDRDTAFFTDLPDTRGAASSSHQGPRRAARSVIATAILDRLAPQPRVNIRGYRLKRQAGLLQQLLLRRPKSHQGWVNTNPAIVKSNPAAGIMTVDEVRAEMGMGLREPWINGRPIAIRCVMV